VVGPSQKGQQPRGLVVGAKIFVIYLVLSSVLWWLTLARFHVDERRLQRLEDSCSAR
jgi:hypothetical protein